LIRIKIIRWKIGIMVVIVALLAQGILFPTAYALDLDLKTETQIKIDPNIIKNLPNLPIINVTPLQGTIRWEQRYSASIESSLVVDGNGTIYFIFGGVLQATNPDGTKKWEHPVGNSYGAPAIGDDGTIYVNTTDGLMIAVHSNGKEKWRFTRNGPGKLRGVWRPVFSSPAIGPDGTIYTGSFDDYFIYAVNPDGTEKWRYDTGGIVFTPTVGPDGTIYFGSDSLLYALKPDGKKKWTYAMKNNVLETSPALGPDGTIYIGANGQGLYAVNPNGSQKWVKDYSIISTPTVGPDGTIYVGAKKRFLALDPSGKIKWELSGDDGTYTTAHIGEDGMIYMTHRSTCYAIYPNGIVKWKFDGLSVSPGSAIGVDGSIYVVGNKYPESVLYALGTVATSVTLNKSALTLEEGHSETLVATVIPKEAPNPHVTWASNNNEIVKVDQTGKVTGIAPGKAKVTATTEDGGFIATSTVTVTGGGNPVATPIPETNLTDIQEHWAYAPIARAVELKITGGYPDFTFRPDRTITRAEFAVMLMNGLKPDLAGMALTFTDRNDVPVWAEKAVSQAVQLGIINGYTDGSFRPSSNITRAEMIVMVVKASDLAVDKDRKTTFSDDADIPTWAKGAIAAAQQSGILEFIKDNRLLPTVPATRAESVTAIVNRIDLK